MPGTELVLYAPIEIGTLSSARGWEADAVEWAWRVVDWGTDEWDRERGHVALESSWSQFQAVLRWAAYDRRSAARMGER